MQQTVRGNDYVFDVWPESRCSTYGSGSSSLGYHVFLRSCLLNSARLRILRYTCDSAALLHSEALHPQSPVHTNEETRFGMIGVSNSNPQGAHELIFISPCRPIIQS